MEAEVKSKFSDKQDTAHPTFGPHPNTSSSCNFEDEVQQLQFNFNLGDASLSKEQQD